MANVSKHHVMRAAACNLGIIMLAVFGVGTPRTLQGGLGIVLVALLWLVWIAYSRRRAHSGSDGSCGPWRSSILAPEHKFPAAVVDARAAFTWVAEQAGSLAIDANRIAIGGDSAGGNLAAVTTISAMAGQCPLPAYQLLIYPVTDLACDTKSYEKFADGYFLTRSLMLWFRDHYLPAVATHVDPQASPLRADLRRPLPPALVLTAGFDPLLDEGFEYAHKMRAAGTKVTYRCHESLIHGFVNMTGAIPAARSALAEATAALRLAFARI